MTISSTVRKAGPFDGTGSQTEFPFEFKVFSAGDLYVVQYNEVISVETVLELDSDYTVTLNADQDNDPGGTIELTSALAVNYTLTITSSLANLQPTDLTNRGGFYPSVINDALDRACIQIQQLQDETDRTLKTAVSVPDGVDNTLPMPAANMVIGWDNTGVALKNWSVNDLVTSVAYGSAKADVFTGDGETVDFYLELDPASINNLDVSVGGVCQVPVDDYTWTSGTKVTFTTAPPDGETVLIRYMQALPQGTVVWTSVYGRPFVDDVVYINQDTTITTPINVVQGGKFVISEGKILTIAGPFNCGLAQCFDGSGLVAFGGGSVNEVYPQWWGAVGNVVNDDTQAITAAALAAASNNAYLNFGVGCYKITGPLAIDCSFGFSSMSYANSNLGTGNPGFYPVGTGYTAVTTSASRGTIKNITIIGDYTTRTGVNGIHFSNPQNMCIENIKAGGLDGFGIKIETAWDCVFTNLITEVCGNASEYAFQVLDGSIGQSSNECLFNRIQAERCVEKAIYISPNTYNCTFNVIHSEQVAGNGSDYTHVIRGNFGMVFNSLRFTGINIKVLAGAFVGNYNSIRVEDDVSHSDAILDLSFGSGGGRQQYNSVQIEGNVYIKNSNLSPTTISGLSCTQLENDCLIDCIVSDSYISTIKLPNNYDSLKLINTHSGEMVTAGGYGQALYITGGSFGGGTLPNDTTIVLDNTRVTGAITTGSGGVTVKARNGTVFANSVTLNGNGSLLDSDDSTFNNGITLGAGTPSWKFGPNNTISGGVISPSLLASPGGSYQFYLGQRSFRVQPSSGQPKSWVCTAPGTPGTWTSEGNL